MRIVTVSATETIEDKIRQLLIDKLKLFEMVVGRQSLRILDFGSGRSFESRIRRLIAQARNLNDLSVHELDAGFQRLADELLWTEESSSRRTPKIREALLVLNEHLDNVSEGEMA